MPGYRFRFDEGGRAMRHYNDALAGGHIGSLPELAPALGTYATAHTRIDGASVEMDTVTDFGAELVREYE